MKSMKGTWTLLLLVAQMSCTFSTKRVINIGAVLSDSHHGKKFQIAVERINKKAATLLPDNIKLNATFILMNDNPVRAALSICEELMPRQVYVVLASHAPVSDLSAMAVSFTCGFYNIPVIGVSARDSAFSDKVCIVKTQNFTKFFFSVLHKISTR